MCELDRFYTLIYEAARTWNKPNGIMWKLNEFQELSQNFNSLYTGSSQLPIQKESEKFLATAKHAHLHFTKK